LVFLGYGVDVMSFIQQYKDGPHLTESIIYSTNELNHPIFGPSDPISVCLAEATLGLYRQPSSMATQILPATRLKAHYSLLPGYLKAHFLRISSSPFQGLLVIPLKLSLTALIIFIMSRGRFSCFLNFH
jgi:hypothetical protein